MSNLCAGSIDNLKTDPVKEEHLYMQMENYFKLQ